MSKSTRLLTATVGCLAVIGALAIGATSVGAKSSGRADSGTVYFAVTHTAGGKEYAAGNSYDKLFGPGAITYVNVAKGTPSGTVNVTTKPVVLFFKNGTLTGTATSKLTPGANGTATITDGKLTASHGTGAQKGHSEIATFSGAGSLTNETYKITYKGTYK